MGSKAASEADLNVFRQHYPDVRGEPCANCMETRMIIIGRKIEENKVIEGIVSALSPSAGGRKLSELVKFLAENASGIDINLDQNEPRKYIPVSLLYAGSDHLLVNFPHNGIFAVPYHAVTSVVYSLQGVYALQGLLSIRL
jgi:hypothetical protein